MRICAHRLIMSGTKQEELFDGRRKHSGSVKVVLFIGRRTLFGVEINSIVKFLKLFTGRVTRQSRFHILQLCQDWRFLRIKIIHTIHESFKNFSNQTQFHCNLVTLKIADAGRVKPEKTFRTPSAPFHLSCSRHDSCVLLLLSTEMIYSYEARYKRLMLR